MKKLFFLSFIAFGFYACNSSQEGEVNTSLVNIPVSADGNENKENLPIFQFESDTFQFGKITQGEKVNHTFKFKNTGKSDLVISSANGSCGCTVPDYPKKPIAPGQEAEINVVFNSEGKAGLQNRSVTLIANTFPNKHVIYLKGEVIEPLVNQSEKK